ncbi:MAG: hypothetical protein AAFS07_18790, partial [Pseudomonadota bacterium]
LDPQGVPVRRVENLNLCRTIADFAPLLGPGSDVSDLASDACCMNGFATCYPLHALLRGAGLGTTAGMVREFSPFIVQRSPIGFAQNPDTPYLTFPVYDMGAGLWLDGDASCSTLPPGAYDLAAADLLNNPAGLALAPLGMLALTRQQALVVTLVTPPGHFDASGLPAGCTCFSLTPNLGIVGGKEGAQYQSGISFSSIGYAYNLYDLQREFHRLGDANTSPFSRRICVIYSYNRSLAERIRAALAPDPSLELITCLPAPAGTTFGRARGPYGQSFLLPDRTNKFLGNGTPLLDPENHLLVSPVLRAAGSSVALTQWYTDAASNRAITVLGVSDGARPGDADFTLDDMNGFFDGSGAWQPGRALGNPNIEPTWSWKRQLPAFTPEAPYAAAVERVYQALRGQMEAAGYDRVWEVGVYRGSFPKWGEDRVWDQNGFETRNYGIQAQGDCPDTYYPVSENVCVGPNQVAVAVALNHTRLGNACYNTVAWYDAKSVSSIGKTVSNQLPSDLDPDVLVAAVSRSDYRCAAPAPLLDGRIQFCSTGTHRDILGVPPTVPLLCMERMYCNPYVLVPVADLAPGDAVTDADRARGDVDAPFDPADLGTIDSLDLPPGAVLRHARDYPHLAAPQSIKATSALPFRVFVFSKSSGGEPPAPDACVDVGPCQDAGDGTGAAAYTCAPNPDTGPCANDGVVAAARNMARADRTNLVRAMVLLQGYDKEEYRTTGFVYLALSIMGLVAVGIAL